MMFKIKNNKKDGLKEFLKICKKLKDMAMMFGMQDGF